MPKTRTVIYGAAGRMGRRLIALAMMDPRIELVGAVEGPGHPQLGADAGLVAGVGPIELPLTDRLPDEADAVIDFSLPDGAEAVIRQCGEQKIALVEATTGLSDAQIELMKQTAREIPLLWAPNMSLAVNLAMRLVQEAARALNDKDADVEILERHHRFKEDSPSGTALKFGQIVSEAMGQTVERHGREGRPGPRPHHEIGYHAVRVGDNPGEHTILFGLLGESIEITVRATSRDCYALGALEAAKFLSDKKPGLYGMSDMLGF